jgi:hypothetical protein
VEGSADVVLPLPCSVDSAVPLFVCPSLSLQLVVHPSLLDLLLLYDTPVDVDIILLRYCHPLQPTVLSLQLIFPLDSSLHDGPLVNLNSSYSSSSWSDTPSFHHPILVTSTPAFTLPDRSPWSSSLLFLPLSLSLSVVTVSGC